MNDLFRMNRWTLVGCVAATLLLNAVMRAQSQASGMSDSQKQAQQELDDSQKKAQQAQDDAQKQAQKAQDDARRERDQALRDAQRERDQAQKEAQRARDQAQRERDQALRQAQREREQVQREAQREREQVQREAQRARDEAARMRADAMRQRDEVMRIVGANVKLVKDKPFTAEAVTESVQVLPDGNRIVRRNQTNYFRDSSGRTRREQTLNGLGPQTFKGPMQTIFIYDPVARYDYVMDPDSKQARRIVISKMESEGGSLRTEIRINNLPSSARDAKEETLPNKMIEGLNCTGKRITFTIPAGEIGNEKPISIVQETWYSPDIEAMVESTTSDPRSGTTTYKLTNVKLVEPPADIFEPSSDYSVRGPSIKVDIKPENKGEAKPETKKDSKPN